MRANRAALGCPWRGLLGLLQLLQDQRDPLAELRHGDLGCPDDRLDLFERVVLRLDEGIQGLMFRRLHGV